MTFFQFYITSIYLKFVAFQLLRLKKYIVNLMRENINLFNNITTIVAILHPHKFV